MKRYLKYGSPSGSTLVFGFVVAALVLFAVPLAQAHDEACANPPSGLISWWRAEGTANDAVDGNHGLLLNGVGYTNGVVGQAFSFDGVDDRITVSNSPSLNFGPNQDFSIEAWVRPQVSSTAFGIMSIVDKRQAPNISQGLGYEFALVDGRVVCRLSDSIANVGTGYGPAGPDLRDGNFHHVAMTVVRSATNGGRLFVDGQVVLIFDPTTEPGDLSNPEPLRIGNHATPSLSAYYKGAIDEVSIYNRALGTNEIAAIYAADGAGKCVGQAPGTFLVNMDFIGSDGPSGKTGMAAVGQVANDYWNFYTRNDGIGGWRTFGAVSNLKLANGTVTSIGMTVQNAPGAWSNGSSDPMYEGYIYPFSGNATITVTNLPAGRYDLYVYANDGNYRVMAGGVDYGVKTALDSALSSPPVWTEGVQYARFTNVQVSAGQPLELTVRPGVYGWAIISGMQIVASTATNNPPPPTCVPAPDNLVSLWKAEGNALDAVDGNNGTLANGATFATGKVGSGFLFNGVNSKVELGDPDALKLTNSLTIEAWIFPTSVTSPHSQIFFRGDTRTYYDPYYFSLEPNGTLRFHVETASAVSADLFGPAIPLNQWSHVAGVLNGASGQMNIYVNGASVGQLTTTVRPFRDLDPSFSPGVAIGNIGPGFPQPFGGIIDELTVFNRPLTQTEIQSIYNAGSAGKCAGQVPGAFLLNMDFIGSDGPSGKTGMAAVGQTANDFWNFYTRNDGVGGWRTFGAVSHLKLANGTVSSVGLTVQNAPGAWSNGSSDPMYEGYIYPFSGNATITVTNLPAGRYDLYVYANDGNYQVTAGGVDYGVQTALDTVLSSPPVWTEGVQYARFTNVQVSAGQPLELTVRPGVYGYAIISGLQITASTSTSNPPPATCVPAPAGLVSWWRTEANVLDSADGNNGTLAGNTTYVAGRVGQGLGFDGRGDLVPVGNPTNLRLQNFTIEAWIKRASTSVVTYGSYGNGVIFGYGYAGYDLYLDASGRPALSKVGINETKPAVTITDTNFHHLAVTKSGSTVIFYVDGVPYSAPAYDPGFVFSTVAAIGARGDNLDNSFLGTIDETAVYNRALSAAEVQAIYNADGSGKCSLALPPVITMQPTNQAVVVGDSAIFSVAATGSTPLRYQWRLGGGSLSGATNSSLVLVNVQPADAGIYSVVVSNSVGTATSSNAVLTVNPPPPCVDTVAGLVSWWRGESNALDSVDGNNGTLQNGVAFAAGRVGQAFAFDGSTGSVTFASSSNLNVGSGGGLSIETWIKPSTVALERPIVEWNSVTGGNPYPYGVHFWISVPVGYGAGPGCLYANIVDTSGRFHWLTSAGGLINTNSFQHVAMTYDKTSGLAVLYLNGAIVAQKNLGRFTPQTSYNLYLGRRPGGVAATYSWAGLMDEVSLYSRALSQSEIQSIFNSSVTGKCQTPPSILTQPASQRITLGSEAAFSVVAGGTPQLRYQWRFNADDIAGATSSALGFIVTEASGGLYSVSVTNAFGSIISSNALLAVNHPPVADASATPLLFISPNGTNSPVVLDGSRSLDPDGDLLHYAWYETGVTNPLATGVVAVVVLRVGAHPLELVVNDGLATGTNVITVEVITTAQAVERLAAAVSDDVSRSQPLIATLSAALASIDRSNPTAAINQLQAFQNQLRAQVMPLDPALAERFIQAAQEIIDQLSGATSSPSVGGGARFKTLVRQANGKTWMQFEGAAAKLYIIEASSDLVHWEMIGVAADHQDGAFEFEDAKSGTMPARFYRIVSP